MLQRATSGTGWAVRRVLALLKAKNPFKVVMDEIDNIIGLLDKERIADEDKKETCDEDLDNIEKDIEDTTGRISSLDGDITQAKNTINDPGTGLLDLIKDSEKTINDETTNKAEATKTRNAENTAFVAKSEHLEETKILLARAIKLLESFYSQFTGLQTSSSQGDRRTSAADPATPTMP